MLVYTLGFVVAACGIVRFILFRSFKLTAAIIIFGLSWAASAQNDDATASPAISIASLQEPPINSEDGEGVYNAILDKLIDGYNGPVNVTFFPIERLHRAVNSGQAHCFYIANDNTPPDNLRLLNHEFIGPIDSLSIVAYIRKDAPDIKTLANLKLLTVAADFNILGFINKLGIKETFALQNQSQLVNMLEKGRVSVLLGYDFGLDAIIKMTGRTDKIKKASLRLKSINTGMSCIVNDHTSVFSAHVKTKLKAIRDSGWLERTFKNH